MTRHIILALRLTVRENEYGQFDPRALSPLAAAIKGRVILAGDALYEDARHVWNHAIDKHPAAIKRVAAVDDIVAALAFGIEHDLTVAVRGGGHSFAGKETSDGLVIDLSALKGLEVDVKARTVTAQPGLNLREFDQVTQAFGLATPLGVVW